MEALAKSIGLKGASSYQRYESSKNYHRKKFLPFDTAARIAVALEGKGIQPVQYADVIALSGIERAKGSLPLISGGDAYGRAPEQVFRHHNSAIEAEDLYAVMTDFNERSIVITQEKICKGRDEIEVFYTAWLERFAGATWSTKTNIKDEALLVEWTANLPDGQSISGADTFVFQNGLIALLTVSFFS
jgi:hypothetical protein